MIEIHEDLLLVNDDDDLLELPDWSKFYIELGYWAALEEEKFQKITILSVPTRAFSSPLIALGALSNFIENLDIDKNIADQRFLDLWDKNKDTTVIMHLSNGEERKGKIESSFITPNCAQCNKEDYVVKVKFSKKDISIFFGCKSSTMPQIIASEANYKLTSNIKTSSSDERQNMWLKLFEKFDRKAAKFYTQNSKECLIIGSQKVLKEELLQDIFAVQNSKGQTDTGNLQNIIRTDDHENITRIHKTDIWSNRVGGECVNFQPKLVIVDGWYSFENHKSAIDHFKCNTIIILNRSEPHYEDAIREINLRYSDKRFNEETYPIYNFIEQNRFPKGIEFTTFGSTI